MHDTFEQLSLFLSTGGPALAAICLLSILTLTLISWKIWHFLRAGAWSRQGAERVLTDPRSPKKQRGVRARFIIAALAAKRLPDTLAREEVMRLAARELDQLRGGLRTLDLIVTIAPLIGLLGTVLGMIEAFQALETSAGQADPSVLAGGIWEALLTTAAGMAVAIPAAVALSWFEGIVETVQSDMEDMATRIFTRSEPIPDPAA